MIGNEEVRRTDDSNLITEFHNEQKIQNDSSLDVISSPPPREALITTAINFLQNERIRKSPINQKQKFLMSKGLTEQEIQIAFNRAGVFTFDPNHAEMGIAAQSNYLAISQENKSLFGKIKEAIQSMALISAVAYACYLFYKKYIERFLFGKKKKTVEEHLLSLEQQMDKKINDLSKEFTIVKDVVISNSHTEDVSQKLQSFKNDLDAIKGLLLNRKQFATPLTANTVPSIPAWQLGSARLTESDKHDYASSEKIDDAGSGSSGSSETEVVTKNSDSSLEIM